jgi:hypothetical protein
MAYVVIWCALHEQRLFIPNLIMFCVLLYTLVNNRKWWHNGNLE